ncbi:hypothetical protein ACE6H2_019290 [Prunus campanulata]
MPDTCNWRYSYDKVLKTRKLKEADDASDAKSGPFLQEEIMSLKGLELLTKHAEPVESAPETYDTRGITSCCSREAACREKTC